MASSRNSGSGVDRLLAQIKPRWTRERHERVFAAIVERIRMEEAAKDEDRDESEHEHDDDQRLPPGYLEGGHTHA